MTDNTRELDDRQHIKFNILVPFLTAITIKRQKEKGNRIKDTETAYYDFAVDLITAYTNKQVGEVLERLVHHFNGLRVEHYNVNVDLEIVLEKLESERNKLKEGNDD